MLHPERAAKSWLHVLNQKTESLICVQYVEVVIFLRMTSKRFNMQVLYYSISI